MQISRNLHCEQRSVRASRPSMSLRRGDTPVLSNSPPDKAINCDTGHPNRPTILNARELPTHCDTAAFFNHVQHLASGFRHYGGPQTGKHPPRTFVTSDMFKRDTGFSCSLKSSVNHSEMCSTSPALIAAAMRKKNALFDLYASDYSNLTFQPTARHLSWAQNSSRLCENYGP